MAEKKTSVVRLIVYLVVAALFILVDRLLLPHAAFRVLGMAAGVLFVVNLLILLLGLSAPQGHRGRTLVTLLQSLLHYLAAIVILCWGLSILGVNVTTIVASVGIVALIVGFGAESLIADVITGVFMLFENQYNVGDIVEVNGFRGTVREIGIRTTSIVDVGGNIKIINNSEMKNILNRSNDVSRAVADISIPYGTDLEALEAKIPALMEEIYRKRADVLKATPVYLGVQALSSSSVDLRFIADVAEKDIYNGARVLNHDLLLGFRKLGVECPFPQVDVHNR